MMEISKRMKIINSTILILIFSAVFHISAESIWEGSAAMGRYGEFPFTGYYGASNSFPQNAFVEVENLENGKRTRVIVVDRLPDSGLLMLVSNEAAQELGIYQSDIARIKVRILSSGRTAAAPQYDDLAYSPDPDLNPAAALMTSEEFISQDNTDPGSLTEPVSVPEIAAVTESEPEPEVIVETEPVSEPEESPEAVFPVLSEMPPRIDDLSEAEILVVEREVPADIAADTPEKPFDWPDTLETKPEQEPVPEPLYLTMDDFNEGNPLSEENGPGKEIDSPETAVLWPDGEPESDALIAEASENSKPAIDSLADATPADFADNLGKSGMELPSSALELLSSGLEETRPAYAVEDRFNVSMLPKIIEKLSDENREYITDVSDYYSPAERVAEVSKSGLPVPEPEIPEEVIALLVGDDILIFESQPENVEVDSNYLDTPEIVYSKDANSSVLVAELNEAFPKDSDATMLIASTLPELPGMTDSTPVEVADGYISPGKAEYNGKITDYPDYSGANEPSEIPLSDEELSYATAPESDVSGLPEMTEVPEVASTVEGSEAEVGVIEEAIPEYNENLEVTLVPAEVRPPELIEEETGLQEVEPATAEPLETDIAEPVIAEAEAIDVPVEPVEIAGVDVTVIPEAPVIAPALTVPDQVVLVAKLQQQKHYLQLGAFKEKNSAIKAAGMLDAAYPVTILADEATAGVSYKLLLGPLSADESGIMLYNFRAGGYSDAFIRRIE